uniref:Uncharacterized protein n=1 Tax=Halomonas sp. ZM3 TaxID=1250400 RepID=K7SQ05_9GAMM|nr:hypothetical protein [Halomonas sp. ZM3]
MTSPAHRGRDPRRYAPLLAWCARSLRVLPGASQASHRRRPGALRDPHATQPRAAPSYPCVSVATAQRRMGLPPREPVNHGPLGLKLAGRKPTNCPPRERQRRNAA